MKREEKKRKKKRSERKINKRNSASGVGKLYFFVISEGTTLQEGLSACYKYKVRVPPKCAWKAA